VVDFRGVAPALLRDLALVHSMLIAAAGAAGFSAVAAPAVGHRPDDGVSALVLLDAGHVAVHTFPERGVLLLDVLLAGGRDGRKALDVFARRLAGAEVKVQSEVRERG